MDRPKRDTRRLNPRHQDMVREKIRVSVIVQRLQACIAGDIEMTPQQVAAARILLDKVIANAPQTSNVNTKGTLQVITGVPPCDADRTADRR